VYGSAVSKHRKSTNPVTPFEFPLGQEQFVVTAAEDAPGPDAVVKRSSDAQVFLIVRYTL
jgi:hypothetical protein